MNRIVKNNKGESVIEILAALVVIMLSFVILTTAIIKGNTLAKAIKESDYSFEYSNRETGSSISTSSKSGKIYLSNSDNSETSEEKDINIYEDNGYYYYEK